MVVVTYTVVIVTVITVTVVTAIVVTVTNRNCKSSCYNC
jgi:hypothetical protein